MEQTRRAVIDRIVDGRYAVLLIGEEEIERNVPVDVLPPGVGEGSWLRISFLDGDVTRGRLVNLEPDEEETAGARQRIAQKMALLRKRGRPK